jgi:alkanesulfonate monooxygenase SsuD/methylene tetrahydromethanopterin reductase-like flavin-dependent oxidoreductase (luciferase family)
MLAAQFCETSFCTPGEFVEFAGTVSEMLLKDVDTQLLLSLEVDGFVGSTAQAAASTMARARRERHGEDLEPVFARALVGDPVQVAERLSELRSAGVAQVVVALHDPHDGDALEALAFARQLMSDAST